MFTERDQKLEIRKKNYGDRFGTNALKNRRPTQAGLRIRVAVDSIHVVRVELSLACFNSYNLQYT